MSAPGDIYELVITTRSKATLNVLINVFHIRAINGGCTATSIVTDFQNQLEGFYAATMTNDATIERYTAFNLIPFNTDFATVNRTGVNGLAGGVSLPHVVAAIITWRTATPGRRYRGRSYFGNIRDSLIVNGQVASHDVSNPWLTFATQILNRWGATGSSTTTRMGVWSRVLGNQSPPHDPAGYTQITSANVQQNVGSMGTRRRGRGA